MLSEFFVFFRGASLEFEICITFLSPFKCKLWLKGETRRADSDGARGLSRSLWECDDFRPQLNFLKALSVDNRNNKTGPQTLPQTSKRAHTHTHTYTGPVPVTNVLKPLKYSTSQRMAEDTRTQSRRAHTKKKWNTPQRGARYGPITKYVPSSQIFKMFLPVYRKDLPKG